MSSLVIKVLVRRYGVRKLAEKWCSEDVPFRTAHLLLLNAEPRKWCILWNATQLKYQMVEPFRRLLRIT